MMALPLIGLAAPAAVDSITTTPATSPSTLVEDGDGVIDLTDITVGGTTHTGLEGATVHGSNVLAVGLYLWTDADPGSTAGATEGLRLNATGAGGGSDDGDYVFSGASDTDTFFLFEVGGNDSFTLTPIDGSGNAIGSLSLTLSSSDFGGTVLGMQTPNKSSGGTGSNATVHGASFTLADFSGSGDTSTLAGFNISTSGGDMAALVRSGGGGGPSGDVDGALNMYGNWGAWQGWDGWEYGDAPVTNFTNTYTTTEFGGTVTTFTFSDPKTGVDISDPDNPVEDSGTAASNFGYEDGERMIGVGEQTLGRFSRGERFSLTCSRKFKYTVFKWREVSLDAHIHMEWTQDGATRELRLLVPNDDILDLTSYNVVPDAGTTMVITNVSDSSEPFGARVGLKYFVGALQFAEEPWYDMTVNGGIPQKIGVNIAGPEFTPVAFYETDRAPEQWEYYGNRGMELIRYPFRWKRLQGTLGGPLDATELQRMKDAADLCAANGQMMIIDMHDYFSWGHSSSTAIKIGETRNGTTVTEAHFRDVWTRIANEFKNHSAIYAYGLMNEPATDGPTWASAAQEALDGIRTVDSSTWILIGGHGSSKASKWPEKYQDEINVTDPSDRIMYEAHVYFDSNSSGTTYGSSTPTDEVFLARAFHFINWLQASGNRGYIGEFNVPKDYGQEWLDGLESFMDVVISNGLSATYWAGGSAWSSDNLYLHPTDNYQTDKPQMDILEMYGSGTDLPTEIIVDNADSSGVTDSGGWTVATGISGYVGDNYLFTDTPGEGKWVEFAPTIDASGMYTVYMNWTTTGGRATAVPVDVVHANGTDLLAVDQSSGGGSWVELGTYSFDAGTSGSVTVSDNAPSGTLVADAVRFVLQDSVADIVIDTEDSGSQVVKTGTWYEGSQSQSGYLGDGYGHDYNSGKGNKSVQFIPDIAQTGDYNVYVRWTDDSNRASNVPYTVTYDGGSQTWNTTKDQRSNGSQWVLLGTFRFEAGAGDHVTVSNAGTNGYVIVDGVKLEWNN